MLADEGAASGGYTVLMQADQSERGFISLSGIVALLVLAGIIFVSLRVAPVFISNYQLQDAIQNLALTASYSPMSEEEILRSVVARANSYGIQLQNKQVTVQKTSGSVIIVAQYTVPVDLVVRQVELHFEPSASNQNISSR